MEIIPQQNYILTRCEPLHREPMNDVDHNDHELFINREFSLLQFNRRVLDQAQDETLPLFERLRFLFICANNLDEFFEVKVAGLKQQLVLGRSKAGPDGLSPQEVLALIARKTHRLSQKIYQTYNETLLPLMGKESIRFLDRTDWNTKQEAWVRRYFKAEIMPVLSPIGLDVAHPFPRLVNKSLNYIVSLTGKDAFGRDSGLAILHAPRALPRLIRIPDEFCSGGDNFVLLNSIIKTYAAELFNGMTITGVYQFRVTRNSDVFLDEENIDDLVLALKNKLLHRPYGTAVRLEIAADCPETICDYLLEIHDLTHDELYKADGLVNLSRLSVLFDLLKRDDLRYPKFEPALPLALEQKQDLFEAIRAEDIVLHHPYHSFTPVLDFIHQATIDPAVLAIKQTLYRTEVNSPMVKALVSAARAGKEVSAVIELRARFDEEQNIELANRLQEAGALVVYGVPGFKTHAKMTLIVRREGKHLRRYAHLGTGNYHAHTARLYSDFGLFTYNNDITDDVQSVFQQLMGMGRAIKLKKILISPFTLAKTILELIESETEAARNKKPAAITAKLNALTDPSIIRALYTASQAGVKINLIVRGMCALRPQVPGLSENITVRAIVNRFLEHSRVYCFYNQGDEKVFISSADWMERNLYHRIEACIPIENASAAAMIKEESLTLNLADNSHAYELKSDGRYKRVHANNHAACSAQQILIEKHQKT